MGLFEAQKPLIFIKDPEIIKMVGIKEFEHFHNHRSLITEETDPLFGNSVVSLQGLWKLSQIELKYEADYFF